MSINLVSIITQFLTPDMIAKIASAIGVDRSLVGKAVGAAVPGLLGSLVNASSTQDGARKIFDSVSQQPAGVLDSLASMIGGPGQKTLVDNGTGLLSSLLGGSATPALAGAVGKFAGLNEGASSSLLGMLAPVVMGTLGKQKAAAGLDASGMAQLLASQKSNISSALPTGFANLIGGSGLLGNIVPGVANAAQAARSTAQTAAADVTRAVKQNAMPGWVTWALPLLVVAALAWWFLGNRAPDVVQQTKTTAQQAVQTLTAGGVDVGSTFQSTIANLRSGLAGVTDAASAQAALPKLQDAAAQLDKVSGVVNQLPAAGKTALAALIAAARPTLDELFNKVLAIPGVEAIAKPTIDGIRAKLDALAKA